MFCIPLHQLEGFRSIRGITGVELLTGQVRHLADEFDIEKASFYGLLGLIRLGQERGESSWTVVWGPSS
jgi:hypothetical protein